MLVCKSIRECHELGVSQRADVQEWAHNKASFPAQNSKQLMPLNRDLRVRRRHHLPLRFKQSAEDDSLDRPRAARAREALRIMMTIMIIMTMMTMMTMMPMMMTIIMMTMKYKVHKGQ